jgi:hypothetical protein
MHEDLEFRCLYLCWVAQLLTPALNEQRRRYACEMVPVLEAAAKDGWYHLATGDESRFLSSYSSLRMWTLSRDEVVTKRRCDIKTTKFMFTVM